MANVPADVDKKQSLRDLLLSKNQYRLDNRFVIRDGKTHPVAILVPGGGYQMVCSFIEGVPIARKLNALGISAYIVYYRVRKKALYPAPMEDLARAVKEILARAQRDFLDVSNYSIWGASAGGHLAASFGTESMGFAKYGLPSPGALVLSYPVITMERSYTHMGSHDALLGKAASREQEEATSVEKHITSSYPRTYIWCSDDDDSVNPDNTRNMVVALENAGIPVKSKIYHGVPHGSGPATGTVAEKWIEEAVNFWLQK